MQELLFLRVLSYVGYYAERGLQISLGVKGVCFIWHDRALVITNLSNRVKNKTMNPKKRQ